MIKTCCQSVQGYRHIQKGVRCQDACGIRRLSEDAVIFSVADGHGNDAYIRAHLGSRFAVEAALETLEAFWKSPGISREALGTALIRRWEEKVFEDHRLHPFTEEELSGISREDRRKALEDGAVIPAYGTTVLAALVSGENLYALQIGDGRVVCMEADGRFTEPVPWDARCHGNITTSLCSDDPLSVMRFAEAKRPKALFLATDGVEDSYKEREENYVFYRELLKNFNEDEALFRKNFSETLFYLSEHGSGDDISLALGVFS